MFVKGEKLLPLILSLPIWYWKWIDRKDTYWGILWIWQTRKRQAECESIATHFVNWCSPCQAYVKSILIFNFSLISHQGPNRDSHSYFISHFDLILWMPQESAGAPSIFTDFPTSSNIHITHMTQLRKCFALGSSTNCPCQVACPPSSSFHVLCCWAWHKNGHMPWWERLVRGWSSGGLNMIPRYCETDFCWHCF